MTRLEEAVANSYLPEYMEEGTVWIVAPGGITDPVASKYQCMKFASAGDLIVALDALGYDNVMVFQSDPFHGGAGNEFTRTVPWIQVTVGSNPPFIMNAGKAGSYWDHGVNPFVGSSYEQGLRDDFSNRAQEAQNGNPDIG